MTLAVAMRSRKRIETQCIASLRPVQIPLVWHIFFLSLLPGYIQGQQRLIIRSTSPIARPVKTASSFPDTAALFAQLHAWVDTQSKRGYLEASVDSLASSADSIWQAYVHLGPRYRWKKLETETISPTLLRSAGYRPGQWDGKIVSASILSDLQEKLLAQAVNDGYPFAQVGLDSLIMANGQVQAQLVFDPGQYILLDTLKVEGNIPLRSAYLHQYLGLHPGSAYNQRAVIRIRERIRALPFLQLSRDPEVLFSHDRAEVMLPVSPRNASRFDFLIGVLPNTTTANRLTFTASFVGDFINQLGGGERLFIQFEQVRPQTQRLDIQASYPVLFGLPIGVHAQANLYKRDTTFLNTDATTGLSYMLAGNDYLKLFWSAHGSRILSIQREALLQTLQLPSSLDVQSNTLGIEFFRQQLDYPFNPRRGWTLQTSIGTGIKRILRNTQVEELGLGHLYDSLELTAAQYRLHLQFRLFIPLFRHSVFHAGLQAKSLRAEQPILPNEQFRVGGSRTLRGFDEDFFQVTQFVSGTLEYRYVIGENSWMYTFLDAAWLDNHINNSTDIRYPLGGGAGITLDTKAGVLGISLAYGTVSGQPINVYRPKVHLGFISLF